MEKGYRYYGTDLTMLDTPFEAGLGRVRPARARARSSGARRSSPRAMPSRRTVAPASDARSSAARTTSRSTAARPSGVDGEVVGRLRSVAYGPTVERTIGYAYLPAGLAEGDALEVDVFDDRVEAIVAADVLVDPAGDRMRG